ncbi:protein of unknown function [Pseudomonas sp. JV551A1]|nr:protein of unknown function [Pseudomonas sp. JV551A1]
MRCRGSSRGANRKPRWHSLTRPLWERPCVAKGLQSSPNNSGGDAEIEGPLCGPFATQGRSHKNA